MRTFQRHSLILAGFLGISVPVMGVSSSTADTVKVTATTQVTARGEFKPNNVLAIWIEAADGTFVKTIGRWSEERTQYLLGWIAKAGANDVDAVTAASRLNHDTPMMVTWDGKNKAGVAMPNGTYVVRMEVADSNVASVAENNEGTFQFEKNGTSSTSPPAANGGFTNVTIDYVALNAETCSNGALDPGETCDGNCPTTCAAAANVCVTTKLNGSAATCDAQCVETIVTECKNSDGCCASGCTPATDNDCTADDGGAADGSGQVVEGGCQTGNGPGAMLVLTALGLVLIRRRKR